MVWLKKIEGKYTKITDEAVKESGYGKSTKVSKVQEKPSSSQTVDCQKVRIGNQAPAKDGTKAVVEHIWEQIEVQVEEEMRTREAAEGRDRAVTQLSGWKTVRVFVSSTFTDMHSEREILVKKVFPELREWCEERKFTLVDCDLRWGVPKDSTSRTTICTCLEEIDRCYEDNDNLPFFISILSDRYGWIPSDSEVPEDIKDKYQWVPQISITHMEILHGAYRINNPNAIYCFRNSSYISDIPSDKLSRFVDKEELNQVQLKVLKEKLTSRFPQQMFEYNCRVDGIDMSTGREKVNIIGLEPFAEKVLQFLKDAINRQYPDHHLSPELTSLQIEENAHRTVMQVKSELFIGREAEIQSLFSYIREGKLLAPLKLEETEEDESNEEDKEEKNRKKEESLLEECLAFGVQTKDSQIVSVIGETGIGKSCLLAKLAKTAIQEDMNVLFHSVGATDDSRTSNGVMRRITGFLKDEMTDHQGQEKIKNEEEENVEKKFKDAFRNAATNERQILIIIDGLDELAECETSQFLSWLPPRFPGNIRCVVSSAVNHYPCVARLNSRESYLLNLLQMTPEDAASLVNFYLHRFNKRLDADQLSSLLAHRSACVPLWMSVACEELRVFGDFATVSAKIKNFPDELIELMKEVLKRLIREDETQAMQKVLSWIYCSQSGLPEKAILSLLGNPEVKEEAPLVTWATVRRHLKPFIRSTGQSQSAKILMTHKSMNEAVGELLFSDKNYLIQCNSYLADFYQYHCTLEWMTLAELPHHLYHANLGQRMIDFYRSDFRSSQLTGFNRSKPLNALRCQWFVHDHHGQEPPSLYLCHLCSFKGNLLSPNPMPTRDMCAICGNWVPWKNPSNIAKLCQLHQISRSPGSKCYVCNNMIFIQSPSNTSAVPLYLCNWCHVTGSTIIKCCHLAK